MILCEGETEEQALPIFFKEYFELEPFELGVNILGVGGSGNYKPFMRIAKDLDIDLFIFSDGERNIIRDVKKHYIEVYGNVSKDEIKKYISFLPDESDFERYLVYADYKDELIKVIDEVKGKESFIENYIEKNDGKDGKRYRTKRVCPKCKQNIFENEIKDYQGDDGFNKALIDCLSNIKTEYSSMTAQLILKRKDIDNIPEVIRSFFYEIAEIKRYSIKSLYSKIEEGEE